MAVNLGNFKRMLMENQAKVRAETQKPDESQNNLVVRVPRPEPYRLFKPKKLFIKVEQPSSSPPPSPQSQQQEQFVVESTDDNNEIVLKQGMHGWYKKLIEQQQQQQQPDLIDFLVLQQKKGELIVLKSIPNMRIRNKKTSEVVMIECELLEDETIVHDWVNDNGDIMPLNVQMPNGSGSVTTDVKHEADVKVRIGDSKDFGASVDNDNDADTDAIMMPAVQDEYLTSRPFPCDFCSRRFRKKANRVNHMVTHRNEKSHICNICGARYVRKSDLMNHLKVHAFIDDNYNDGQYLGDKGMYKSAGSKIRLKNENGEDDDDDDDDDVDVDDEDDDGNGNGSGLDEDNEEDEDVPMGKLKVKTEAVNNDGNVVESTKFECDEVLAAVAVEQPSSTSNNVIVAPVTGEDGENAPVHEKLDPKGGDPYYCRTCRLRFADTEHFIRHCETHENRPVTFNCQFCDESYLDFAVLQEHCRVQHKRTVRKPKLYMDYRAVSSKQRDYVCNYCDSKFANLEMLKNHRMKHVSDMIVDSSSDVAATTVLEMVEAVDGATNRRVYVCQTCNGLFASAIELDEHEELCRTTTTTTTTMKTSKEWTVGRAESPDDAVQKCCFLCAAEFGDEKSVQLHIARTHKDDLKPNICHLCGKRFSDERSVQRHILEHSSERGFTCDTCNKNFSERNRLKRHQMTHRDKTVKCVTCNCIFPDARSLSNHRHLHAKSSLSPAPSSSVTISVGASKLFPCHICHKTFGTRSSQLIHIRLHTGEKPYGCTYCYKAFRDGGTLRKHIRIHTGEKPYKCAVCPRAFNQRVVLRDHIRSHHSAPDPALAHQTKPYKCSVCNETFALAPELIVHLIQHCDDNTALSRKPPGYTGLYRTSTASSSGKRALKGRATSNGHVAGTDDDDEYASIDDVMPQMTLIRSENQKFEMVIEDGTFDINHDFIPDECVDSATIQTEIHKSDMDNQNNEDSNAIPIAIKNSQLLIDRQLEKQLFPQELNSFADIKTLTANKNTNTTIKITIGAATATTATITPTSSSSTFTNEPPVITRSRRKVQKTAKLIELEKMNQQRKRRLSSSSSSSTTTSSSTLTVAPTVFTNGMRRSSSSSDDSGTTCDPNSELRTRQQASPSRPTPTPPPPQQQQTYPSPNSQIKSEPMFYYDQLIGNSNTNGSQTA